ELGKRKAPPPLPYEEPEDKLFEELGKSLRIDIPITDLHNLRKYAELLRSLAQDLDVASRRTLPVKNALHFNHERRLLLLSVQQRVIQIRNEIRRIHGPLTRNGYPK